MENLALISSNFPIPVGSLTRRRLGTCRAVSCELSSGTTNGDSLRTSKSVVENLESQSSENIFSSAISPTHPIRVANQSSYIGSPMLWIGVGIGLSAFFSVMATKLKRQAILHAFKTVMGQDAQDGKFHTAAFSPGSPFPYHVQPTADPVTSSRRPVVPQTAIRADDPPADVPAADIEELLAGDIKNMIEHDKEAVNPESNILHQEQTPIASKEPSTVDATRTEFEATPLARPTTEAEAL